MQTSCSFRWFIVAENTVRWFVMREKHFWMAADSADPAKRTEFFFCPVVVWFSFIASPSRPVVPGVQGQVGRTGPGYGVVLPCPRAERTCQTSGCRQAGLCVR
jgi:hypothetical protein